MPLPNILHSTPILIQPFERDQTIVDPDYREPVQQGQRSKTFSCPGQMAWTSDEFLDAGVGGANEQSHGYVLFRLADVRAAASRVGFTQYRLKQNDRFIQSGIGLNSIEVDLYIVDLRYVGHYADQGGASLVKAFFRDRSPSKQNRGGVGG